MSHEFPKFVQYQHLLPPQRSEWDKGLARSSWGMRCDNVFRIDKEFMNQHCKNIIEEWSASTWPSCYRCWAELLVTSRPWFTVTSTRSSSRSNSSVIQSNLSDHWRAGQGEQGHTERSRHWYCDRTPIAFNHWLFPRSQCRGDRH